MRTDSAQPVRLKDYPRPIGWKWITIMRSTSSA